MLNLQHVVGQIHKGHWDEAQALVQKDNSMLGAWLQGILLLNKGALSEAEEWYVKAGRNFKTRGTVSEELRRFEAELLD